MECISGNKRKEFLLERFTYNTLNYYFLFIRSLRHMTYRTIFLIKQNKQVELAWIDPNWSALPLIKML